MTNVKKMAHVCKFIFQGLSKSVVFRSVALIFMIFLNTIRRFTVDLNLFSLKKVNLQKYFKLLFLKK